MRTHLHFRRRPRGWPAAPRAASIRGSRPEPVPVGEQPVAGASRSIPERARGKAHGSGFLERAASITVTLLAVWAAGGWGGHLGGQVFNRDEGDELRTVEDAADDGVSLLGDRARERQLDQARRLFAEERWSDAALVCDEILAAPGDAFLRRTDAATRRSLKAEAAKLLKEQPPPARRAYELLHGARAERILAEAIASDDQRGMLEVARRWFDTSAGREAALIAAYLALEDGQAAVAASWLERLAVVADPVLAGSDVTARAVATLADRVRGGAAADAWLRRQGSVRDWYQHRGDPTRNPVVAASRPLLAARYRVPLTRDPGESRLLWHIRQDALGRGQHLLPVGTPVVVDDRLIVQTGWGLLAVEFTTGRRLWLGNAVEAVRPASAEAWASAGGTAPRDAARLHGVFEDATAAGLTAAAGLVIAVEPAAAPLRPGGGQGADAARRLGGPVSNMLVAYDPSGRGVRRWKLPEDGSRGSWYLGPPLAVGDVLFALVEERGGVRVDCIDARTGAVQWSQPLADLEENRAVTSADGRLRRLAGFTPALGDGMLVCPIGAGTVIAIDLATRSLSWAHRYRTKAGDDAAAGGRRVLGRGAPGDGEGTGPLRLREAAPVIAEGRVLLTPPDSDRLICLDLREGTPAWPHSVDGGLDVAGVVDGRVIVIGPRAVEAIMLEGGQRAWRTAWLDVGGQPSGRGIVTPDRLLLPLDSAEVVELRLADGRVAARSGSRGGVIPGNLVACRGEIISRSVDSLDVFHQVTALESRLETAAAEGNHAWAEHWRGQLDLEQGRVAEGLAGILAAARSDTWRPAPNALCDAFVFALRQDFAVAAPAWDAAFARLAGDLPRAGEQRRRLTREIVSGFLDQGDLERAWDGLQQLVEATATARVTVTNVAGAALSGSGLSSSALSSSADRGLVVSEGRWLRGRLAELHARAGGDLRQRIDAATAAAVVTAAAAADPERRLRTLESLVDTFGRLTAADDARARFLAEHDRLARLPDADVSAGLGGGQAGDLWNRRRDVLAVARNPAAGTDRLDLESSGGWPLGRVAHHRSRADRDLLDDVGSDRLTVVPVTRDPEPVVPGMGLLFDARMGRLLVRDHLGRIVIDTGPLDQIDLRAGGIGGLPVIEASAWGRLLFVRSQGSVTAFDLASRDQPLLWTRTSRGTGLRDAPLGWLPSGAGHGGGRAAAQGRVALGMIVSEAEDASRAGFVRGGGVSATGVLHHDASTLSLLDPVTGRSFWERHGLMRITEVAADETFACVIAPDDQESLVLSMDDGRVVRRCEVPRRRERLGTHGRRLVVVRPVSAVPERPVAAEVSLSLFDPVSGESHVLGVVPGDSRAVLQDDRLFVLSPHGEFTAFALGGDGSTDGHALFRVELPEMPAAFTRLLVIPGLDRLLVIAGVEEANGLVRVGNRMPLRQSFLDRDVGPPLSGAIWAVDRASGARLWAAPARIDGYSVPPGQPAGLPLLLLCRQLSSPEPQADGRPRLGLLCLDKRTGHAVVEELGLRVRPDEGLGCDVSGDPDAGTVTVRQIGGDGWRITLHFTGEPMPPRPPFRGTFLPAGSALLPAGSALLPAGSALLPAGSAGASPAGRFEGLIRHPERSR
jgi:outer membrane protein assembly factor BamB